ARTAGAARRRRPRGRLPAVRRRPLRHRRGAGRQRRRLHGLTASADPSQIERHNVTTTWLDEVFGVKKPVIAMLHLAALPGDPGYDSTAGIVAVVARARGELDALQSGGVDGVMIS